MAAGVISYPQIIEFLERKIVYEDNMALYN